jgi:hypothetical protein
LLPNNGGLLKLSDSGNQEVHCRHFIPGPFTKISAVLAPDSDGTRTFIFLIDGDQKWIDQLTDGTYRFTWTFRGDAGNDLPVLRRFGSPAHEQTMIEFNVPAALP